jgi:hypothetical protein
MEIYAFSAHVTGHENPRGCHFPKTDDGAIPGNAVFAAGVPLHVFQPSPVAPPFEGTQRIVQSTHRPTPLKGQHAFAVPVIFPGAPYRIELTLDFSPETRSVSATNTGKDSTEFIA